MQLGFFNSGARFAFYVGGIGAGKTTAGALRAIKFSDEHPGSLGVIGAPTYTMLRDTTLRTYFQLLPTNWIASYTAADHHLRLTNGSEILFRSLDDPDRLRGLNLAWFWLDEAPLCGHYAWQILKGRLRQRGYLTAGWATGTPKGRDGYWREFEAEPDRGHILYRASTRLNRFLPAGYIEDLGYTGAFALQEIEGRFVAFDGLVYTFEASVEGNLREPDSGHQPWSDVIGGVDWGYTNPAAALVFGLDSDDRAWQLDEWCQRRASLDGALIPALLDLTRRHHVRRWYCGPDEPEHIAALAAALAREGLPCRAVKADNAVRPGIQTVTALLAPRPDKTRGLYVAPRCRRTIAEFSTYQYAPSLSGPGDGPDGAPARPASEEPLKRNDHCMDALRYALHTALTEGRRADTYLANLQRMTDAHANPSTQSTPQ